MDPSFFEMLENFIATVRRNFLIFTNADLDPEYIKHHIPSPDLAPITIQNEQAQNKLWEDDMARLNGPLSLWHARQGQPSLQDKRNSMIEAQRQQRMVDMLGPGNYILPSRGGPKPAPPLPIRPPGEGAGRGSNPRDALPNYSMPRPPAPTPPRPIDPKPSNPGNFKPPKARPSMSDQFLTRYERDVQDGKVKAPSPAMSPPPVMKPAPTPKPKPATKKVRAV